MCIFKQTCALRMAKPRNKIISHICVDLLTRNPCTASGSVNWQNSMEDSWATSVYLSELQKPIPFVPEVPLLEISLIDILVHV